MKKDKTMDVLYEHMDLWKHMFNYLDYDSRINLNRVYKKSPIVKKLSRHAIESHHIACLATETLKYVRKALETPNPAAVTRAFAQVLRPRFAPILRIKILREMIIKRCIEFIPDIETKYRSVLTRVLHRALDQNGDFGKAKKITVF